jgi:hypothetical protein
MQSEGGSGFVFPGSVASWTTRTLLRFVSGYRWSDTVSSPESDTRLGAARWDRSFSANGLAAEVALSSACETYYRRGSAA